METMPADFHAYRVAPLQQRSEAPDSRQQQQDNGTHEFQPPGAMAALLAADAQHTLRAYLERCRERGELPKPPQRPALRLAKH
jgi:hypothetical protein